VVICLDRGADLHIAQLMPLLLTVSCFSKIQIGFTFLVPANLGSTGKRAVKQVCECNVPCETCCQVANGQSCISRTHKDSFVHTVAKHAYMQHTYAHFLHLRSSTVHKIPSSNNVSLIIQFNSSHLTLCHNLFALMHIAE